MNIKVCELRVIAEKLFDNLEETGHSEIEIDRDDYWDMIPDEQYDPYTEPKTFTLGQLSFEWEILDGYLKDDAIKDAAGLGGADNILFDFSGGVFHPDTLEFPGSLTEGGAR